MADHTKYATLTTGSRVPDILFLLDMVASAPHKGKNGAEAPSSWQFSESRDVYYDHRTFGPLLHFFLHSSPLYRELLLLDEEDEENL